MFIFIVNFYLYLKDIFFFTDRYESNCMHDVYGQYSFTSQKAYKSHLLFWTIDGTHVINDQA